jgi:hypothetical protein
MPTETPEQTAARLDAATKLTAQILANPAAQVELLALRVHVAAQTIVRPVYIVASAACPIGSHFYRIDGRAALAPDRWETLVLPEARFWAEVGRFPGLVSNLDQLDVQMHNARATVAAETGGMVVAVLCLGTVNIGAVFPPTDPFGSGTPAPGEA